MAIEDGRFEGHEGIPVEVTLQTPYIWWLGAPLTAIVLIAGVWFASRAADQTLLALEAKVALPLFALVVAAAAQTFRTNVLADQAFGYDPIVQWGTLAWAIGSAVLAAATGAFGTEKLSTRVKRDTNKDPSTESRPAHPVGAPH